MEKTTYDTVCLLLYSLILLGTGALINDLIMRRQYHYLWVIESIDEIDFYAYDSCRATYYRKNKYRSNGSIWQKEVKRGVLKKFFFRKTVIQEKNVWEDISRREVKQKCLDRLLREYTSSH